MNVLAGLFGEIGTWAQVIVGVGLLIFIHELGHFLVAKWAGVRVLAFSLGFGPVLAGFRRGDTHYRLSLIPLGGYVKMSGEVERPEGGFAEDDYPSKPVGVRALIIAAGVIMNAVLGYLLFAAALFSGVELPPATVGYAVSGDPAWEAGLRPGDRILRSNGNALVAFQDLVMEAAGGEPLELEFEREGRVLRRTVTPRAGEEDLAPRIGVGPVFGNTFRVEPDSPVATAGLRTGDELLAVEGIPATTGDLFQSREFQAALLPAGGPLHLTVLRDGAPVELVLAPLEDDPRIGIAPYRTRVGSVRPGGAAEAAGWRAGDRPVAVAGRPVDGWFDFVRAAMRDPEDAASVRVSRDGAVVGLPLPPTIAGRLDLLRDLHFPEPDSPTRIEVLDEGPPGPDGLPAPSPAAAAGIPDGARVTAVDGAVVTRFRQIDERVRAAKGRPVTIAWEVDAPDGGPGSGESEVTPVPHPVYAAGKLWAGVDFEGGTTLVRVRAPGRLLTESWHRSVGVVRQIGTTIRGIFGGTVDKSAVGGPVLIAQIAHRSSREGIPQFLWLLAALSLNLMVLNILPIPLLDGGQLALLGVEAVTGRPPSEAVVGISQLAGLVLLLGLILFITFNDIARIVGG